jgi:hypothetical protein
MHTDDRDIDLYDCAADAAHLRIGKTHEIAISLIVARDVLVETCGAGLTVLVSVGRIP